MIKLFCLNVFIFISTGVFSQNSELDSLQTVLKTQKEDTNNVNTLLAISRIYYNIPDFDKALLYAKSSLFLSEKLNFKRGEASSYTRMGWIHSNRYSYAEAFNYFYKALNLREELGEKQLAANMLEAIGNIYKVQNNYTEANNYYFRCLKIFQEFGDTLKIAYTYNGIGDIYITSGRYLEAYPYFLAALDLYKKCGNKAPDWSIPYCYGFLGEIHQNKGDSALAAGDKLTALKEYEDGMNYYLQAVKMQKELKHQINFADISIYTGNLYIRLHKYTEAKKYFQDGLKIALEFNHMELLRFCYRSISRLDSIEGNYKDAFKHYKLYIAYRDSLVNEESTRKTVQSRLQYEFDKKEAVTKAEQDKQNAVAVAEISRQKTVRNFSIAGAFGILSLGGVLFYNFRKRKKLENQKALADERLRISRDLHDDMGASLSSISVFSSAVKQKLINNETLEAEQLLDRMSTDAQEMVSGMSEMVWTISPHNDTIEKLTDRLQVYAASMLSVKNISFTLHCDEELKNQSLSMEMRKNIFLIFKEAINNASKYSGATEVKLMIYKKENRFVVILADNGKGFDIAAHRNRNGEGGNGLKNMHQRADEIQSKFEINSVINKGTSMELTFII